MALDASLAALRIGNKDKPRLDKLSTSSTEGIKNKKQARKQLDRLTAQLADLQYKLYAQGETGLLVVFQATDTGGKDGVIRNVFGPLNPQGVQVTSFKQPSSTELAHDYLWRIHMAVPAKGTIRVFNRSHYEDVLVPRVHKLLPEKTLEQRYRQINEYELYLSQNNIVMVKFFLHIAKDEQKERLQSRLDNPDKRWKFHLSDVEERGQWDSYQEAYQTMLEKCSTTHAPWYVIPADHKWYRDWAVASILLHKMQKIDPHFPEPEEGLDDLEVE